MKRTLWMAGCLAALALTACQRGGSQREQNPLEAAPVDTARVKSADVAAWPYRREISADLDGDKRLERVVIAADVHVGPSGPIWEDGHRWAVYVEASEPPRTMLYGAFVANGFTEAAVLQADNEGRRRVMIQERTPQQIRAFEVEYEKPGKARLSSAAFYQVGEWLPGAAVMR